MQLSAIPYVVVGTLFTLACFSVYPLFSGNWSYAHISIPVAIVAGFCISYWVLRKYDLPLNATYRDMGEAVKKDAASKK